MPLVLGEVKRHPRLISRLSRRVGRAVEFSPWYRAILLWLGRGRWAPESWFAKTKRVFYAQVASTMVRVWMWETAEMKYLLQTEGEGVLFLAGTALYAH